jgi:hypothetical protein
MNTSKILTFLTIIGIGVIIVFLEKSCEPTEEEKSTNTVYKYDTIVLTKEVYKPPITKREYLHDTIIDSIIVQMQVDTAQIIKEYFSLNIYNDTISDSLFTIYIIDSLTMNEIKNRDIRVEYVKVEKTITETIKAKDKFRGYVGCRIGVYKEKITIAPAISVDVRKNSYEVSYDILNNGILVSYKRQIK